MLRQNNLFRLIDDRSCLILCVVNIKCQKGHMVDALAVRGDEGRGTLR